MNYPRSGRFAVHRLPAWFAVKHGRCDRQAMLPAPRTPLQARAYRLRPWHLLAAASIAIAGASAAHAQDEAMPGKLRDRTENPFPAPSPTPAPAPPATPAGTNE